MLAQALPRVKADPNDLDARMDCQIGTWLSMGGAVQRACRWAQATASATCSAPDLACRTATPRA